MGTNVPEHAGLAKTGPGEIELTGERATLYLMGAFGASKFEAAEFRIGSPTSEGNRVVQWRKPRARKWEGYRSKNLLVVLDGLGHPDHPTFDRSEDGRFKTTRYATFDPAWHGDFDRFLAGYLEQSGARVLLDARPKPLDPPELEAACQEQEKHLQACAASEVGP